ncbi:MAG: response regulator [Planctomycetota bacterium]|nr:MAG: response regulator [Planctomycetota bacterium]
MAFILLIDDREETRELVQEILEDEGHRVKCAPDWVKGNSIIIRERPDLVLLDINMPGIKGTDILKVLKETVSHLPKIILYSGMDQQQLSQLAQQYGADGFIQKGSNIAAFLQEIENFLD